MPYPRCQHAAEARLKGTWHLGSPIRRVQVIMQAQRENPPSFTDCKDKFLVQSCLVGSDIKDVSGDVFDKAQDVKQTKLRVVLTSPPKPPSPVPEGVEEDASPANGEREDDTARTGGLANCMCLSDALLRIEKLPIPQLHRWAGRHACISLCPA